MNLKQMMQQQPEYYIRAISFHWAEEEIYNLKESGKPPGITETAKIREKCFDYIYAAVERGDLEATYLEKNIIPKEIFSDGSVIRDETKDPSLWVVETSKYIEWAKSNSAGPSILIDDIKEYEYESITNETLKVNSSIHDRLIQAIKDFEKKIREIRKTNPNRKISLDNDIRPWLKINEHSLNDRENFIFGKIVAEHYDT